MMKIGVKVKKVNLLKKEGKKASWFDPLPLSSPVLEGIFANCLDTVTGIQFI